MRHFRGRLVMPKKPLNAVKNTKVHEDACKHWQVICDSCRSTCCPSALNELSPHIRQNQNNRRSSVFDPSRRRSTLTPEYVPHWRSRRTQVQVWIAFVFTGLSFSCSFIVSSTVLYSASCRRLYRVTSLLSEAKKWEQSHRQRRCRRATTFRSDH